MWAQINHYIFHSALEVKVVEKKNSKDKTFSRWFSTSKGIENCRNKNFLTRAFWEDAILMFLPYKARKWFTSKITKWGTFKVSESKYVTNKFCFHDEFEKSKALFLWIFHLTAPGRGKTLHYSIKKGFTTKYGFPPFLVQ